MRMNISIIPVMIGITLCGCSNSRHKSPVFIAPTKNGTIYRSGNFSVALPSKWILVGSKNEQGDNVAEQRFEFESTERGKLVLRSYGNQPSNSIKRWVQDFQKNSLLKNITINSHPAIELRTIVQ